MTHHEWSGIQEIIDALPFCVLLLDADHNVIATNSATRCQLGHRRNPIEHHCLLGGDAIAATCPLHEAVACGDHVEREMPDSAINRWALSSVFPTTLRTQDGRTVYLHFLRDITQRKETSAELSRSLEHHKALNEILQRMQTCQTSVQVLEVVIDHMLALSWMGLTTSAAGFLVEGGHLRMAVKRNLSPALEQTCARVPLGQCLCGKAALSGEMRVYSEVDSSHDVRYEGMQDHGHVLLPLTHLDRVVAVFSFYLPHGVSLDRHRVFFLETVSALAAVAFSRLEMQAQLVHSDRMASMGILASVVGHEIRVPLNALSINVQRLERVLHSEDQVDREKLLEIAVRLDSEIQRINNQLQTPLLALAHQQTSDLQLLDVNNEVVQALQFIGPEACRKEVTISHNLADGMPQVRADPVKLRRILINLILNGVQAVPRGGEVRLSTHAGESMVEVHVRDNGPGIAHLRNGDLHSALQVEAGTREVGKGLGLAICSRLVREMGGGIHYMKSEPSGAHFKVRLPLKRASS